MSRNKKESKTSKNIEDISDDEDVNETLDSYHYADEIYTELQNNKIDLPALLKFNYFDAPEKSPKQSFTLDDNDTEPASETESIHLFSPYETEQTEDDIEEHPLPDEDDDNTWPGFIDRIIYGFQDDFVICRCLMNKYDRKVYTVVRREDQKPMIIIVANDNVYRLKKDGMPREVRLMKRVRNHENIANLLGWCPIDKRHYALVMPYYESCDVILATRGNLVAIAKVMHSILTGLSFLHQSKVAHRDLSKDNILWDPVHERAVIIDFDTSCFYRPQGYFSNVGRDKYDAPEKTAVIEYRKRQKEKLQEGYETAPKHKRDEYLAVNPRSKHNIGYTEKADVYSVGVLFYMLLYAREHSPKPESLKRKLRKLREKGHHKRFAEIDLLLKMLNYDPSLRISASEALQHPFFQYFKKDSENKEKDRDFAVYNEMKQYLDKMVNSTEDEEYEDDEDYAEKKNSKKKDDKEKASVMPPLDLTSSSSSQSDEKKEDPKDENDDDDEVSEFSSSESD
jgi:serine/threonine protein kinase